MSANENDNSNEQSVAVVLTPSSHDVEATITGFADFVSHPPPIMHYLDIFNKSVLVFIIAMVVMVFAFGPLITAKVMVAGIFAGLALVCIIVAVLRDWILMQLRDVEEMGYFFNDLTKHDAQQARVALSMLNERLDSHLHPVEAAVLPELLRNVGPLVRLLMKKEKSTMSWVMLGAKVAKNAFDIFKNRTQS